jgi:hypothetical protein
VAHLSTVPPERHIRREARDEKLSHLLPADAGSAS